MSEAVRMVIDDPSKFHLLSLDMKEQMIKGGIATVNVMAAKARKEAIKNLKSDFTIRNNFTANQVKFTSMPQGRYALRAIQSIVGVTEKASYMARQETGGEHTPRQGSKLAIPTNVARGGSFRNPVQKGKKVKDVRQKKMRVHGETKRRVWKQLKSGKRGKSKKKFEYGDARKSLTVARAYIAFKHDLYLPMGGSGDERNLFEVVSFTPIGKGKHRKVEFELEEVYNFERKETRTQARPWLLPACEKVAKDGQKIFISQMKKLGM
jgi:hypothetical protein